MQQSPKTWLRDRWGWVVVVASFWTYFITYGVIYCYGLLYIALQEEFQSGNAQTAWIGSICLGVAYIATLVSPTLVKKFGNKKIASIGLGMLVLGCISTSFMPKIQPIYFTFGILVGIGTNLLIMPGYILMLRYFPDKNAPRALSLSLIGSTVGMMTLNPLTYILITELGWRQMLRIMGAICFVIGIPSICTFISPSKELLSTNEDTCKENVEEIKIKERKLSRRQSQASAVYNKKSTAEQIRVLLFPELWFFVLAILGTAMVQSFYIVSFVAFVKTNGYKEKEGAMIMTVIAVANIMGKIVQSVLGDKYPFPKIYMFNVASIMGIIVMISLLVAKRLWVLFVMAIVTGVLMSIFDCIVLSVSLEVFGPERTIQTTSILLAALGIGCVMGSLFGMSVDSSGSYDAAIYGCIGIYITAIVLFTSVPIYQKSFAKERYIMVDYKENLRRLKYDDKHVQEKENMLHVESENKRTLSLMTQHVNEKSEKSGQTDRETTV